MPDGVFIFFLAVGRVSHTASSKMTPSILLSVPPLFTLKKTRNIFSPRSGGHAFQKANATALWERSRTFARSGFFRFKNSDVQNDGNRAKNSIWKVILFAQEWENQAFDFILQVGERVFPSMPNAGRLLRLFFETDR